MAQDIFSAFKNYAAKLSNGEKNPAEMAAALKVWLEDSGEMIKDRIEEEIEKAGERLGFIRKEELEKVESDLLNRITKLEAAFDATKAPKKSSKKTATGAAKKKEGTAKKPAAKKSSAKKVAK
ncbi:MAG: hypothetical protein WCO08_04075 [Actinomycetes bacterium]